MATLANHTCVASVSLYMQKYFNRLVAQALRTGEYANYGLRVDNTGDGMLILTGTLDLPNSNRSLMVKETIQHPGKSKRNHYKWSTPKTEAEKVAARLGVFKPRMEIGRARGYNETTLHSIVQKLVAQLEEAYKDDTVQNPTPIQTPIRDYGILAQNTESFYHI